MMVPIEIWRGSRFDPKHFGKLEGKKVWGVIYHPAEEKRSPQTFQERLVEILTSGDPNGFYKTEETKNWWRRVREHRINTYGGEALIELFPEEGHRQYRAFLNPLGRRAGIYTVPQLLAKKEEISEIRGIGPSGKRLEAVKLIISHFQDKAVFYS